MEHTAVIDLNDGRLLRTRLKHLLQEAVTKARPVINLRKDFMT